MNFIYSVRHFAAACTIVFSVVTFTPFGDMTQSVEITLIDTSIYHHSAR